MVQGCTPEPPSNPFAGGEEPDPKEIAREALVYDGLPGLQDRLFKPTCANSGCHDGAFEPDFRTLGSTHATLVNQAVIKNDSAFTYTVRVAPGSVKESQLVARLTEDIDGNSGIMPLVIEPNSRYPEQRDTLIDFVRRWIAEGAQLTD